MPRKFVFMILVVGLVGCTKPGRKSESVTGSEANSSTKIAGSIDTNAIGEPPESVLQKLIIEQYENIERQGGFPVTITATGKSLVLHPKVYSAKKDECHRTAQTPPGHFECGLSLMMTLQSDEREPLPKGERIFVKSDGKGGWIAE